MTAGPQISGYRFRRLLLIFAFISVSALLLWRAFDLQVLRNDFLREAGDARSLRVVTIPAHRGMITDRNGEPLAISTPVDSVWVTPRQVLQHDDKLNLLARMVDQKPTELRAFLESRSDRDFVYLKRQINPDEAKRVEKLDIPGVNLQREYKRFYPAGEITAHLVGFTNVDDQGQEGVELAYDHWLRGTPGSKRVLKDRLGRTVQDVESIRSPDPGKQLALSIDRRVQYLAYRELKLAVAQHHARGGTVVMMDPRTGEVIAMAVQPSYNPNNREDLKGSLYRNRAITDVFEPGSTMKPFTVAAALMTGRYTPQTMIATGPGYYKVSDHLIRDISNYGTISVSDVIMKSSDVGASKIALSIGPESLWNVFTSVGFGRTTGCGFPGEADGVLRNYQTWSDLETATAAFGYGVSVTALQLAHAYTILADDGIMLPVSLTRVDSPPQGRRVLPADVVRQVRTMMEAVVGPDGTGTRAEVEGYRIAGKTGTVHKAVLGGYAENRYMSLFAGIAPATKPRLVLVVVIDEPRGGEYYGGQVSAPVFARVMAGALRILDVPPDDLPAVKGKVIVARKDDAGFAAHE